MDKNAVHSWTMEDMQFIQPNNPTQLKVLQNEVTRSVFDK